MIESGKCDVCGQDGDIAIYSSGLGPISWSYCAGCTHEGAEPLCMFEYTYEECGDDVADFVRDMKTVSDGVVISWSEFVAKKKTNDT